MRSEAVRWVQAYFILGIQNTMAEIGNYINVHYITVGRAVRTHEDP